MKKQIRIIFENNHFIAINKPAGLLSEGEKNSVVEWFKNNYPYKKQDWPDKKRLGLVHRLDKNTSGILLVAKNPVSLQSLQNQFQKRSVSKTYTALVHGRLQPKEGDLVSFLESDRSKGRQRSWLINWQATLKEAKTHYKTERAGYLNFPGSRQKSEVSLLTLKPLTGRTHQLRAQLKQLGVPIVGDDLYSTKISRKFNKLLGLERQFLHAGALNFSDPLGNKPIEIKSALPTELNDVYKLIKWQKSL